MRGACAEDQAFEQRVGGQAVGAVDAGAGGLSGGVEAGQSGAAEEVGADAAHQVMRGGADGDEVAAEVERVARQDGADAGKAVVQIDALDVAHVEMDDTGFSGGRAHALAGDGAGHHVAGSQLEQRMIALHEALAAVVEQDCALAA